MANPYEHNARERKAQAIAGALWAALTHAERTNPALVPVLRVVDLDQQAELAAAAGQKAPSAETWERVLAIVTERQGQEGGPDVEPETMNDATDTCACRCCGDEAGGSEDCPVSACYRGRVSGFHDAVTPVPCSEEQREAVDRWLDTHAGVTA